MLRALAGDSTITSLPTDFPLDFFGVALLDFAGVLLFPFLALGLVAGLAFSGFSRLAWSMVSPILYMVVPQTEQTPLVVACPVRVKVATASDISRCALHFRQ